MKNLTTSDAWAMLLDTDIRDTLRHLRDIGDAFGIAMLRRAEGCTIGEIASEFRHNTAGVHLLTRAEWQGLAVMSCRQAQEALLRDCRSLRALTYERRDEQVIADLVECCWSEIQIHEDNSGDLERVALTFLADAQGPLGVSPVELESAARIFAETATEVLS